MRRTTACRSFVRFRFAVYCARSRISLTMCGFVRTTPCVSPVARSPYSYTCCGSAKSKLRDCWRAMLRRDYGGRDVRGKARQEALYGEILRWLGVSAGRAVAFFRENQRGLVEEVLKPKLPQEDLVAFRVRAVLEFGEDLEVRFGDSDWPLRSVTV